ncbi:MAG: hypothetical protein R3B07_27920 [Polyangiaceae bacterium]
MTDQGGLLVELLKTGTLDDWITTYDGPVTSVIAKPGTATSTTLLARRETAFVIRLETMEIVEKIEGSLAGIGDSSAKTGMQLLQSTYLK